MIIQSFFFFFLSCSRCSRSRRSCSRFSRSVASRFMRSYSSAWSCSASVALRQHPPPLAPASRPESKLSKRREGNATHSALSASVRAPAPSSSAASALSANTVVRSLFGAGFPLFAAQMYEALNPRWASTLLGFVAIALAPIPFVLRAYGHHLRRRSKYSPTGDLPVKPPSKEEKEAAAQAV